MREKKSKTDIRREEKKSYKWKNETEIHSHKSHFSGVRLCELKWKTLSSQAYCIFLVFDGDPIQCILYRNLFSVQCTQQSVHINKFIEQKTQRRTNRKCEIVCEKKNTTYLKSVCP